MHSTVETIARTTGGSLGWGLAAPPQDPDRAGRAVAGAPLPARRHAGDPGSGISATLPAGSQIELTLELDRGGHLSARAFVPALSQVFEQVAHLLVPDAAPEVLTKSMDDLRGA